MTFVSNEIQAALIPIVAGLVAFGLRQHILFDRVVVIVTGLQKTLDSHTASTKDQETRITVLENTVSNLHELTMAVQALSTISTKLDTLLEATIKRTDMLEDLLYNQIKEHKCPHCR